MYQYVLQRLLYLLESINIYWIWKLALQKFLVSWCYRILLCFSQKLKFLGFPWFYRSSIFTDMYGFFVSAMNFCISPLFLNSILKDVFFINYQNFYSLYNNTLRKNFNLGISKSLIAKIIFTEIWAKYLASRINPKISEETLLLYEFYFHIKDATGKDKKVNQR